MLLLYEDSQGKTCQVQLTELGLTIGRSTDCDITLSDEKASRMHCGIRFEDNHFLLRDLKSKNGTFLNDEPIDTESIRPGDRFRVGSTIFHVEAGQFPGPNTAVHQVEEQMADGKGYRTILREIVDTVDKKPKAP
jgi:pSer/pThr/pTyr-binding forkhead associated (FHA) protein